MTIVPIQYEQAGELAPRQQLGRLTYEPRSLPELIEWARTVCNSDIVPKEMRGKPENVILAVQHGNELGLSCAQSLQSIYIVNGRPSIYGDAMLRMLMFKARAYELRGEFPDLLKGIRMVEEMLDVQDQDVENDAAQRIAAARERMRKPTAQPAQAQPKPVAATPPSEEEASYAKARTAAVNRLKSLCEEAEMNDHPMQPVLDAFKPLFDAAEEVKESKERRDKIYTLTSKLFIRRDHSTEGQWMEDYEDAERMVEFGEEDES